MEIEVSDSEQKFLQAFLKDEYLIGIPLNRYAWNYIHHHKLNIQPGKLHQFIREKAEKSGEDFRFVFAYHEEYPVLLGSALAHRFFYKWLLNQKYTD